MNTKESQMKKKRILSLLLVVAMMASLLTGCGSNVALKDVEADPAMYVEEGLKKSLSLSPIGGLLELDDPEAIAMNLNVTPVEDDEHIKIDATIALKEIAMLCNLDASIDGEDLQGSLFVDKENIAVKSELLTEIFDTASIGLGLNDFANNFKASAWYQLLIVDSGIEEELKTADGETVDLQAIVDLYADFLKEMNEISKDCVEYAVIEDAMTIDGKEIKGYKITQTTSKDATDKIAKALEKFLNDMMSMIPAEEGDMEYIQEEIDEMMSEMTETINKMIEGTKTSYFVAKKGGAVIEMRYSSSITMTDSWSEEEITNASDVVVSFGADPEKVFAPEFSIQIVEDDTKMSMTGKGAVDVQNKSFNLDMNMSTDYPDDYEWLEDENYDIDIALQQDSKYTLTVTDGEETHSLTGKFKIDGTKVQFSVDGNEEENIDLNIDITIDFGAKKPVAFEYEDLMKWDEEKIQSWMEKLYGATTPDYDYSEDFE
jgi:hypothetical protein